MKRSMNVKQMICVGIALILAMALTMEIMGSIRVATMQRKISGEVFRFHVIANSDSDEDQALKMKVKERVISFIQAELPDSKSVEMTEDWARLHLEEIESVARMALEQEGCEDKVTAEVTNCYFPDKTYGDVTFPKGYYNALRIKIGNAKGRNWWCVLFPNLCFIDSIHAVVPKKGKDELKAVLDEDEYEMVTANSRFKIRWFFFR